MLSKSKPSLDESPTVRLMQAMRFGGKDLDHNRAGEISPLQRQRMNQSFVWNALFVIPFGLFIEAMMLSIIMNIPEPDRFSNPAIWVLAAATLPFVVIGIRQVYRHYRNVTTGTVIAFTGRVRNFGTLIVAVNYSDQLEQIFGAAGPFIDGETYTFYSPSFAPTAILAAEHVPAESREE